MLFLAVATTATALQVAASQFEPLTVSVTGTDML